jgi:hypothetical protein
MRAREFLLALLLLPIAALAQAVHDRAAFDNSSSYRSLLFILAARRKHIFIQASVDCTAGQPVESNLPFRLSLVAN